MKIDRELVESIAELAQLAISPSEIDAQIASLQNVLALVESMNEVDTSGVAPMANPLDAVQRLRADQVTEQDDRDRFQRIAPETDSGLYLVPKVVE